MLRKVILLPVGNSAAVNGIGLVARSGTMRADGFVWNVASPAFDPVIHGKLADRPESFVIKSWYVKSGAQLFVKLAKILQVHSQSGQFYSIIGKQKFLVAGIPQTRELSLNHNGWQNRELEFPIGALAKLRAATVFFHTHHAARAAYGKAKSGHAFNSLRIKALFDIPHGPTRLKKEGR